LIEVVLLLLAKSYVVLDMRSSFYRLALDHLLYKSLVEEVLPHICRTGGGRDWRWTEKAALELLDFSVQSSVGR
jgi:hypothetical protein